MAVVETSGGAVEEMAVSEEEEVGDTAARPTVVEEGFVVETVGAEEAVVAAVVAVVVEGLIRGGYMGTFTWCSSSRAMADKLSFQRWRLSPTRI